MALLQEDELAPDYFVDCIATGFISHTPELRGGSSPFFSSEWTNACLTGPPSSQFKIENSFKILASTSFLLISPLSAPRLRDN